jgi:hypothetical protein
VLTRHLMASLHEACQDVGCELVVTVIPPRSGHTWDGETLDLVEYVRQRGIRFIDLTPAFWDHERQGMQDYHPGDGHWNTGGHRLAAEIFYEFFVGGPPQGNSVLCPRNTEVVVEVAGREEPLQLIH